jgi:DNA-binding ferritin-like protein
MANPSEKQTQTRTAAQINATVDRIVRKQVAQMEDDGDNFTASMLTAMTQRYGKGDMTDEAKKDLLEQLRLVGGED